MSGINTGILNNAHPLSTDRIKELEKQVLESNETFAYLDENSELCFSVPFGVDNIKDFAWYNAYELSSDETGFAKKVYRRTGIKTYSLDKVLQKSDVDDPWEAYESLAPGLYQTGTSTLSLSWDELVSSDVVKITDGTCAKGSLVDELVGDLVLPNDGSITKIGRYGFYNCTGLTGIAIPDSITIFDDHAFNGCEGLTRVYITDLSKWCNITFNNYRANPLVYAKTLYLNGKLVTNLVIPNNVTTISNRAFQTCTSLTSVTIPDSVTSIGDSAFSDCTGLESVTLPNSLTAIDADVFNGCTSLMNINISDNITSIGYRAFKDCTALIEQENGVHYVGKWATGCDSDVSSVSLRAGTRGIADRVFENCDNLITVTIPDGVIIINYGAFYSCDKLTKVTIPDSVMSIGNYAFYNCKRLTSVNIPDGVTEIGSSMFYYCSSLTSINIPDGVTSIGSSAFYYCNKLTSITIPDSVTSIGWQAFYNCKGLSNIYFDGTVEQWNSVELGSSWAYAAAADYVQCTDGQVER
jgi:hypothetical protein